MSTHFFKITLCYDKKWEIKLCIPVNIYHKLLKLGMSTHVFKISLYYDKKWEIKLHIPVNIYHRLLKLGMSTHVFKISLCYDKKWEKKLYISVNIYHRLLKMWKKNVSQLISIIDFQNLVWVLMFSKLAYTMKKMGNKVMYPS